MSVEEEAEVGEKVFAMEVVEVKAGVVAVWAVGVKILREIAWDNPDHMQWETIRIVLRYTYYLISRHYFQ